MMRRLLAPTAVVTVALLAVPAARADVPHEGRGETMPPTVPVGFVVTPMATPPAPTSLSFSPDGARLYVATVSGQVLSYPVLAGVVAGPPSLFMDGLELPLGVLATAHGVFVADLKQGSGRVWRARDNDGDGFAEQVQVVISGLPVGRHNTNGMALGPVDGLLYITNGNSTDSGFGSEGGGGAVEVQPWSGSLLRVDPTDTGLTPTSPGVAVVGTGWRNIYDVTFAPAGHPLLAASAAGTQIAAVPMNGPDGQRYNNVQRPRGEDTLSLLDVGGPVEHFGFPWCLYDRAHPTDPGLNGFTQDVSRGACNPLPSTAFTGLTCPCVQAKPSALFGMHVSADGLAFNPSGPGLFAFPDAYDHDLFVTEWGNLFGSTPMGHKVVRVRFDAAGAVAGVEDFLTLGLPLDLTFALDGSLWIADFEGTIYRVAPALPGV